MDRTLNLLTILFLLNIPGSLAASQSPDAQAANNPVLKKYAQWEQILTPVLAPQAVLGSYTAGCLVGAEALPLDSRFYNLLKPSRNRYYGHSNLISYIQNLSLRLKQVQMPPMLVEDLGGPRGGPFLSGHASHQNGLDVDISLSLPSHILNSAEREEFKSPSYVTDRKVLRPNWGPQQVQLIVRAADAAEVNRIFVAPAIKKYFCQKFPKAPWLYRLRAWWGHDDHIHVRLNCPADSSTCEAQAPLDPLRPQCGADLAAWFSAKADLEWAQMQGPINPAAPITFPRLPLACEAQLQR